VKEHKRTEEEQKDLIFDIFSEWRNSTHSDRTQTYFFQLCEQIYKWYKDYRPKQVDSIGLEIATVINNFLNKDKKLNLPKDKDKFFGYLNTSLINEGADSDHEYKKNDNIKIPNKTIRIPIGKKRKLKKVDEAIKMKESDIGRELNPDERRQVISKWFKIPEYVKLLNVKNLGSISYTSNNENDEVDVLNFVDNPSFDPLDEYINKTDMETVLEAVKTLLGKKQERARDCYRALFTLHCIKNELKGLYPILDQEIIDAFHKHGKNLNLYEIYQKYHPNAQKSGAEAMASTNLREFLNAIETYIKGKNQ